VQVMEGDSLPPPLSAVFSADANGYRTAFQQIPLRVGRDPMHKTMDSLVQMR